MNAAKIRLSATEMELVKNADWILTKNSILQKTNQLLGELLRRQQAILTQYSAHLPIEIIDSSPKISRGDNYKGLPYLVLDYPRQFSQSGVFAIRTMFWWGNFFCVTLHLTGHYKEMSADKIVAALPLLKENGYYYCINTDEWEHHFESTNYRPIIELGTDDFTHQVHSKAFLKLAKKIPLNEWDEAENKLLPIFELLLLIVTDQLPKR
jgi:hypothetical protein